MKVLGVQSRISWKCSIFVTLQLEFLQHYFVREDGNLGFLLGGREHTLHNPRKEQLLPHKYPLAVYEPKQRRFELLSLENNQEGDYPVFDRQEFFDLLRRQPDRVDFDAYDRRESAGVGRGQRVFSR